MDGPATGVAVFAFLFSSAMAGVLAHARLPGMVMTTRTAGLLRGGGGILAGMAGTMLVLLTLSVKRDFDTADRNVRHFAAEITDLDHTLRRAGPVAIPAREILFRYAARTMKDVWPTSNPRLGPDDAQAKRLLSQLEDAVAALRSTDPTLSEVETQAHTELSVVADARWNMEERTSRTISPWMLAILVFWLMLTFASLGLLAPRTPLALPIFGLGALALAGAVFLVVEYADPYEGIIAVSSEPMQNALFALSE